MPTYEYRCESCGHQFEVTQRITEPKLTDCPTCGKSALERLISAAGFVLKGGGWYRDGYGKASSGRTDNDRIDRLQKAINDDKSKSEGGGDSASSAPAASPASPSGGDKAA